MAGKKPDDFSIEPVEQTDAPPSLDFEVVYGALNLPDTIREIVIQKQRLYRYTDTGLEVYEDLTDQDWREMLPEIRAIKSAYQCLIGDWMIYGFERGFEVSYEAMAKLTGYTPGTVEVFTSVCRSIPRLIRINRVFFGHYQLIAPLPEVDRKKWVKRVAKHGWSVRDLKAAIRSVHPSDDDDPPAPSLPVGRISNKEARQNMLKLEKLRKKSPETWSNKEYRDFLGAMEMAKRYLQECEQFIQQGGGDLSAGETDGA
jgi:hypothetical protein